MLTKKNIVVINNKYKLISDNTVSKSNIYFKDELLYVSSLSLVMDNSYTVAGLDKYMVFEVENGKHIFEIFLVDKLLCSITIDVQKDEYLLLHNIGEDNPVIDISNEEELKKEDKENKKEK